MKNRIYVRSLLIIIAGFGCFAGASLSLAHAQQGEICPMLGPIPACIIVFFGYLSMLIAALFIKRPYTRKLFFLGWIPVFALALMGVVLELSKGDICPSGALAIPQCFYSLAMVVTCLALYRVLNRSRLIES